MPPAKPPVEFVEMFGQRLFLVQDNNKNHRRLIYERTGPNIWIEYFKILKKTVLGNHYHREKDEHFEILEGDGRLYLQNMDICDSPAGHMTVRTVAAGDKILVKAYTAHAFVLNPGSRMVCRANKTWNPDKKDLKRYNMV